MFKLTKAAVIIAVFLMVATSGCYTKFKTSQVKIVPDTEDKKLAEPEWDFGWGWYDPTWGNDNSYYIYYNINWWDQCRWCEDEDIFPEIETFNATGKIARRNDPYIPPGAEVQPSNDYRPPVSQVTPPSSQDNSRTSRPIVENQKKLSNNGGDDDSNNKTKTKRRRR